MSIPGLRDLLSPELKVRTGAAVLLLYRIYHPACTVIINLIVKFECFDYLFARRAVHQVGDTQETLFLEFLNDYDPRETLTCTRRGQGR